VSRIVKPVALHDRDGGETTAVVSVSAIVATAGTGIAGSEAYMSPELLAMAAAVRSGDEAAAEAEISASVLFGTDAFACGCVVAHLCSGGEHPFSSPPVFRRSVPDNIMAGRRRPLEELRFCDPRHAELVNRLTAHRLADRWTSLAQAIEGCGLFGQQPGGGACGIFLSSAAQARYPGGGDAEILLDRIEMSRHPGTAGCLEELLKPVLVALCPWITAVAPIVESAVRERLAAPGFVLPSGLTVDGFRAIMAYSADFGNGQQPNVYYTLNCALRNRKSDPKQFRSWRGYLFYLMRALETLPKFEGDVYVTSSHH
jgi:hypothetical protein